MLDKQVLSIYIHIPFCRSRCTYCDFNTYAELDDLIEEYVNALITETKILKDTVIQDRKIQTIYFGGGTPTILNPEDFELILEVFKNHLSPAGRLEITIEANPTQLDQKYFQKLKNAGVNRLSLGMQSAVDSNLKILGRKHSMDDVTVSVQSARRAGFQNINLDLIFGIPTQTVKSFETTLNTALELKPEHLSLYALSLEESTLLWRKIKSGELPEPDEDVVAEMYTLAMQVVEEKGYRQYEISNWAADDQCRCLHNLQYWRNGEYVGLGAGAHSHYNHSRWENIPTILEYIQAIKNYFIEKGSFSPASINVKHLQLEDEIQETLMMGMRLTEGGILYKTFEYRFGQKISDLYGKEIDNLIKKGLLEKYGSGGKQGIRLTRNGRLLGNQVFREFIRV